MVGDVPCFDFEVMPQGAVVLWRRPKSAMDKHIFTPSLPLQIQNASCVSSLTVEVVVNVLLLNLFPHL